jgi:2-polyprenyl-3-methyl-5-hydroxy-6-metoxy-1,4-benzoquinol methylase
MCQSPHDAHYAATQPKTLYCRNCGTPLEHVFTDLGLSPLCGNFLSAKQLREMEAFYPLCTYVCSTCYLVQVQDFETPEAIFREYAYFSSYSESWLEHARNYSHAVVDRFQLNQDSFVVEIASNDGYMLKNFVAKDIPVLGIDPARNVAAAAQQHGVRTLTEFFSSALATELAQIRSADLMIANNVLAHVPNINDFVGGFAALLAEQGVATFEFPHLLNLIKHLQFDTIYHEHFSYLSLVVLESIFAKYNLRVFDIETLATHGGSLRLYVTHLAANHLETPRVESIRNQERAAGLHSLEGYLNFDDRVRNLKHKLMRLLLDLNAKDKTVVGYGAPGKGNTLLNYCGIHNDLLAYTVDRNPYKQGKFLPGTHIPVYSPDQLELTHPDYIMLLPWNLQDELMTQLAYTANWGAKVIIPIPEPHILSFSSKSP